MKTSTNLISRFRIARMIGLVACVAWPLILMLLIMTEKVVPGNFIPEGLVKEFSYTLTGLTLAGTFFVNYRSGKVLSRFKDQPNEKKTPHRFSRIPALYPSDPNDNLVWINVLAHRGLERLSSCRHFHYADPYLFFSSSQGFLNGNPTRRHKRWLGLLPLLDRLTQS